MQALTCINISVVTIYSSCVPCVVSCSLIRESIHCSMSLRPVTCLLANYNYCNASTNTYLCSPLSFMTIHFSVTMYEGDVLQHARHGFNTKDQVTALLAVRFLCLKWTMCLKWLDTQCNDMPVSHSLMVEARTSISKPSIFSLVPGLSVGCFQYCSSYVILCNGLNMKHTG